MTLSLSEWRLMQAARVAVRFYPEVAAAIEIAGQAAVAIVDQVLRDADEPQTTDPNWRDAFYQELERRIDRLADQRLFEEIKGRL